MYYDGTETISLFGRNDGRSLSSQLSKYLKYTCENPGIDRISYPNGQAIDKATTHTNNQLGNIKHRFDTTGTGDPLGLGWFDGFFSSVVTFVTFSVLVPNQICNI